MSQNSHRSRSWPEMVRDWWLGRSSVKRDVVDQPPETAAVEFLEHRQVLTSISITGTAAEQLAAETIPATSFVKTDQALAMAVQSDGKIVLVGSAEINTDGNTDFAVTRLNADGSLDNTFGTSGKKTIAFDLGGVNTDAATCVAIQADGKIVIGGYAQRTISGDFDFAVVRLNTNGSLDETFSTDGKATIGFNAGGNLDDRTAGIAIQSDGKIVLVGYAKVASVGTCDFAIARLDSNGQLDTTFSTDGLKRVDMHGGDDRAAAVKMQADGRIVVVGSAQKGSAGYDFGIARITPTGSMDRSFTGDGRKQIGFNLGGSRNDLATSVAIQTNGAIVIGGTVSSNLGDGDFGVARISSGGTMDNRFGNKGRKTIGFDQGAGNEDQLSGLALQSDGKIVLGGLAQVTAEGDYDFAAVRLNTDGTLDTTFSADGKKTIPFNLGGTNADLARTIAIQTDGKILLGGSAMKANPADSDFAVARLNSDGQLDDTFGTGGLKSVPFDLN